MRVTIINYTEMVCSRYRKTDIQDGHLPFTYSFCWTLMTLWVLAFNISLLSLPWPGSHYQSMAFCCVICVCLLVVWVRPMCYQWARIALDFPRGPDKNILGKASPGLWVLGSWPSPDETGAISPKATVCSSYTVVSWCSIAWVDCWRRLIVWYVQWTLPHCFPGNGM